MKSLKDVNEVLIVVDMVNGFVKEGVLADKSILSIVDNQIELLEDFSSKEECIIFVNDTHSIDSIEFKNFPVHCLKNSSESRVISELSKYLHSSYVIEKNSTSAIFANGFLELINSIPNLERITIVGCETDICVVNLAIPLKNYFNEINKDVEVIACRDAIETYDSPNHNKEEYTNASLLLMSQSGVSIKNHKEILQRGKEMILK